MGPTPFHLPLLFPLSSSFPRRPSAAPFPTDPCPEIGTISFSSSSRFHWYPCQPALSPESKRAANPFWPKNRATVDADSGTFTTIQRHQKTPHALVPLFHPFSALNSYHTARDHVRSRAERRDSGAYPGVFTGQRSYQSVLCVETNPMHQMGSKMVLPAVFSISPTVASVFQRESPETAAVATGHHRLPPPKIRPIPITAFYFTFRLSVLLIFKTSSNI